MHTKTMVGLLAALAAMGTFAAKPAATALVTVDPSKVLGPIRDMSSVNGGPHGGICLDTRGNFRDWTVARIPMARTHDCVDRVRGGAHACDITAVFPDFDADENDPKNYDFVFTDYYLDTMVRAGTKPFFRLGQTIEVGPKKYGVLPPKDFAKWARICEHVIRHYNEGWGWATDTARTTRNIAWSNQFDIVYWEIWNEPDNDEADDPSKLSVDPRFWGGTVTNFFTFYETAARHLKAKFPNLKIGGPANAHNERWGERFLQWCEDRKVPLDFYSWHRYDREPEAIAAKCDRIRRALDRHGFAKTESILNEWNYVKGWETDDWDYSLEVERGRFNQKGAAFVAATMIACQSRPVDHLMYYDARPNGMNGLFEMSSLLPMKGYYPFYAWARLADRGTQVACTVSGTAGLRAVAAKGADGSRALFVARFCDDNNVTDVATVTFALPGLDLRKARCCLTDSVRTHTDVPLLPAAGGAARLPMQPNSFALVEW